MPPRWAVLAIVVFWLAVTAWQIQRDMWPSWFPPPDEPPPYEVDMTDEFGTNYAVWDIQVDGKDAGNGTSEVVNPGDGTLKFNTILNFQPKPLLGFCAKIESTNRITNKGQLLNLTLMAKLSSDEKIGLEARIDEGLLKSRLTFMGVGLDLDSVKVPENGIVFNPALVGTRIRQLRKGQTWRVPLLNVGEAAKHDASGVFGTELRAAVDEEVIRWSNQDVLCFKIEFTQPGKGVVASTWVRQRDGQVLKQQAKMLDIVELLLVRVHSNN